MGRRRHTPEQIITALREAEVGLASGKTAAMVSRELGPHSACGGRPPAPETIKPSPWFLRMPQLQGPPMALSLT